MFLVNMEKDKLKNNICARKRLCPICKNAYVYLCMRCLFILISRNPIFLKTNGIYQKANYFKMFFNLDENRAYCIIMFLYLYNRIYRKILCLESSNNLQTFSDCQNYSIGIVSLPLEIYLPKSEQKKEKTGSNEIKCKSMASIPNFPQESSDPGVSNVKSKKSSSLLSALVRRNKKKNKKIEASIETINISSHNLNYLASNSSLELHNEEEELDLDIMNNSVHNIKGNRMTISNINENLVATDSDHSVQSVPKAKNHFFRKLIKKQSSENVKKKSEFDLTNDSSKLNVTDSKQSCKVCLSDSTNNITQTDNERVYTFAPTSHINLGKSTLSVTLANGLHSVEELTHRVRDSENHLIQLLTRYIKDAGFQKELMENISQYSKLQREAERRASALASDMWMHQLEIGRAQERTLQETLNSLVKQNRQLQIDNEIMFRKHERLVRKLRSFPEMGLKYKCMDCSSQLDSVIKHNEKLQEKLDAYVQQIESLENELQIAEKQNDGLEQQLRHSSTQINNLKTTIQRSKTDHQLELLTLNYEIQKNERHIKDNLEAGDDLLEDIEGLKKQFKGLPVSINWSKCKIHGKCLTDLIFASRSCINELSKEVLSLHAQISIKEKDIESLQDTNSRLQENLKKSATELNNISKKLDETGYHETDKIISEQKCKILESDLKAAQEKIENLKMKFELEKTTILNSVPEYENLAKQISEKDKMIEHTKLFITNITSENLALRNQVDTLNRSLAESGAGDVVKELAHCQEQLAYIQSQYYHLLNEKQVFLNEIENLRGEKKATILRFDNNFKELQKQLKELEKKNEENSSLKQQFDSEHQTVLSLQHERMKYLEEKNILKTIFQHMKAEISRVQKLESAVADISKEASKLAVIAEYNKQIGEQLQTEVHEKDQTILQLRSSVEKLNDIQIQNTKEKLSLCYELSEVCHMKEQLNTILSMEMQKNVELDDTKREIVQTTSSQIKQYEEMQKNERSTLTDLVLEYKLLVNQRDNILKEKEKLEKEIFGVREAYKELFQKCEIIAQEKNEKDLKIAQLLVKEKDSTSMVNSLHEKLNFETDKYDSNTRQLETLIRQLRKEKEDLDNSVKYLQNNIQRLHHDLNESRKNGKETKDLLNKAILEKEEVENDITELNEDKEKLKNEVVYLNSLCEKVLSDFEASIKSSVEKEEIFKKEIQEAKSMIISNSREIERLTETILIKQREIEKLVSDNQELKVKEDRFKESIKSFEEQNQELRDIEYKKQILENEINNLRIEHDSSKRLLSDVRNEIDQMQNELKLIIDKKEEDYMIYKSLLDDEKRKCEQLSEKNKQELNELKLNLKDVTQKLENERLAYGTLSEIHKEVSAKFLKSIKNYTDEKNIRQEAEGKLKETIHTLENMKTQKEDLQQQINILLDGLNDEKNRINTLSQEKKCSQESLDDLQGKYNELLSKCLTLEHQVRGAELGVSSDFHVDVNLKEHVELLHRKSKENHDTILALKETITRLQQQITTIEFQKSELTLRLHEIQRKYETEQNLGEQLKNTHKLILASVLKLKDDGKVDAQDCNHLLHMVKNSDQ